MLVTVYTVPSCRACTQTKRHLERRGIPYVEESLDGNRAVAAVEQGFTTAPIVHAHNGTTELVWDGYRPDRIDKLGGNHE